MAETNPLEDIFKRKAEALVLLIGDGLPEPIPPRLLHALIEAVTADLVSGHQVDTPSAS